MSVNYDGAEIKKVIDDKTGKVYGAILYKNGKEIVRVKGKDNLIKLSKYLKYNNQELLNATVSVKGRIRRREGKKVETILRSQVTQGKNQRGKPDNRVNTVKQEEIVKGIFGGHKGIKAYDKENNVTVKISKESIKKVYENLNLKDKIIDRIIEAHDKVLTTGFDTGNERVIAIDTTTGETVADEIGTPTRVEWRLKQGYEGRAVTIHNHPDSTYFSPVDLYYFGVNKNVLCMAVQCHNGKVFILKKTIGVKFEFNLKILRGIFSNIRKQPAYKDKTFVEKGRIFVETIAKYMKWVLVEGD